MSTNKPTGSGYFAIVSGSILASACVSSFFLDISAITGEMIVRIWLASASIILLYWGFNRVNTGVSNKTIGQDTINLVIAVAGVTVAIMGMLSNRQETGLRSNNLISISFGQPCHD